MKMQFFVCLLVVLIFATNISIANANDNALMNCKVKGTISLPTGTTAPNGGLKCSLVIIPVPDIDNTLNTDLNNLTKYSEYIKRETIGFQLVSYYTLKQLEIPQNASSVDFETSINLVDASQGYAIACKLDTNKAGLCSDYLYYSSNSQTTKSFSSAFIFSPQSNNQFDVNLEIFKNANISGMINLPNGLKAPAGGMDIVVEAIKKSTNNVEKKSVVTIPEGKNEVEYSIEVNSNLPSEDGYILRFAKESLYNKEIVIYDKPIDKWLDGVCEVCMYGKSGGVLVNPTIIDVSNGNVSNINIELLPSSKIKGSIVLPEGTTLDSNLTVYITAIPIDNSFNKIVSSPYTYNMQYGYASRFTSYSLNVPKNQKYKIMYEIQFGKNIKLASSGYYYKNALTEGITKYIEKASIIDANDLNTEIPIFINTASEQNSEPQPKAENISLTIGDAYMTIGSNKVEIDPNRGTTPIIKNSRTLLPIRSIIEALGGTVEWNDSSKMITLSMNNTTIEMFIDNPLMKVNGVEQEIDPNRGTAPEIINNRTMIPIRGVIESFGGTIEWNAESQSILISIS